MERKTMIPVAFITDENFLIPTGVAICSLKANKLRTTEYMVYVIMAECNEKAQKEIMKVSGDGVKIQIIETSLDRYKDIKQLSHIPISCLLKFDLCDMIAKEDKIIYLDGDIYVRGDLTRLYEYDLKDNFLAGVPSLEMIADEKKLVNAGILVFNAKKMRDSKMSEVLVAKRRELGDRGSMDQQTFNLVMSDNIGLLPYEYNCIPQKILGVEKKSYPIEKLNKLYATDFKTKKEMVDKAVIIHYATGEKPWKYSFVKCGDEWYQSYLQSPYGQKKLKRASFLEVHYKGVIRNIRKGGIKALFKRFKWYIDSFLGKADINKWG